MAGVHHAVSHLFFVKQLNIMCLYNKSTMLILFYGNSIQMSFFKIFIMLALGSTIFSIKIHKRRIMKNLSLLKLFCGARHI